METPLTFSNLSDGFSSVNIFTPSVLWLIFLLALGIFAILSAILLYHWREYSPRGAVSSRAIKMYFSVSGGFVLLLLVSLLSLTF